MKTLIEKRNIVEEQKKEIGIEPVIDIKHFVRLFFANLASMPNNKEENKHTVSFDVDYKKIINKILCGDSSLIIKYAELIDICDYYEFQKQWEDNFDLEVEELLNELNGLCIYNFGADCFEIDFSEEEINNIKKDYDERTLEIMNSFCNMFLIQKYNDLYNINVKTIHKEIKK